MRLPGIGPSTQLALNVSFVDCLGLVEGLYLSKSKVNIIDHQQTFGWLFLFLTFLNPAAVCFPVEFLGAQGSSHLPSGPSITPVNMLGHSFYTFFP